MFQPFLGCDILLALLNSANHKTFCMADEQQQDGQKTLVAFVVGLLIGGMLVWAFSGPAADAPTDKDKDKKSEEVKLDDKKDEGKTDETNNQEASVSSAVEKLSVGEGKVSVEDQAVSKTIALDSVTYPVSEGWIGVREYNNEKLGYILGVARFSESQGLIPSEIHLLRPTTAGNNYAIVIYKEDGDFDFNLAGDVQLDQVFDTFTAQ